MSVKLMSEVWGASNQKGDRLLVLLALADYSNDEGYCWPSQTTLAEKTRCSRRGIQKILGYLIKAGEIEEVRQGGAIFGNQYETAIYKVITESTKKEGRTKDAPSKNRGEPQCKLGANLSAIRGEPRSPKPSRGTIKGKPLVGKARGEVGEIVEFCKSEGLTESDGRYFFNHWESNGWTVSNRPIQNWKAVIRKWKEAGHVPSQKVNGNGSNGHNGKNTHVNNFVEFTPEEIEQNRLKAEAESPFRKLREQIAAKRNGNHVAAEEPEMIELYIED